MNRRRPSHLTIQRLRPNLTVQARPPKPKTFTTGRGALCGNQLDPRVARGATPHNTLARLPAFNHLDRRLGCHRVDDHPKHQLGKHADRTSPGSARMSGLSVAKHIDLPSDRQPRPDLTGATVRRVWMVASETLRAAWVGGVEAGAIAV